MLQMVFFYRKNPWYAGQFVRKIVPKIEIPDKAIPFFTTLLNKQKPRLLNVLVRNVDDFFSNTLIKLPVKNGDIDISYMETLISAVQKLVIRDVVRYADRNIAAAKEVTFRD